MTAKGPARARIWRTRSARRGVTHVGAVLEAAMVMGWFVVMIVGEKSVSRANDARRSAENKAMQTASTSSGRYCKGGDAASGGNGLPQASGGNGLPQASGGPDVFDNGKPQAERALAAIAGLGIPRTQTFPYYTDPLKNVRIAAQSQAQGDANDRAKGKTFHGERQLGCVEKPLDKPKGTLDEYRQPLWQKNLQGY